MKAVLVALFLALALPVFGIAQSGNATVSGIVTDSSSALIPGVTVKATNTQTGILTTAISNESGAYSFASLQPGDYRVSAELPGFQTQVYSNVRLGTSQQVRLNFTMQVASVNQTVEVVLEDTLLATTSSSVGTVLGESSVRDLPIIGRDALELVNIMAGFREPVDPTNSNARTGANGGFVAGISVSAVNTTRDGISVNDGRYNLGVFSATHINPDLVGELRIILAPVDAETGRGSGQVQIMTRSGTNKYTGAAVWNIQNTALNANTWNNNRTGTVPSWFNRHQLSLNYGGPIVRNKTFFFVLYDGQRMWSREAVRATVLTSDARKGDFRFFGNVVNGNADAVATGGTQPVAAVVDKLGNPLPVAQIQAAISAAGSSNTVGPLQTISVYGRDPNRLGPDPTGYIQRIIDTMPLPNDFTGGDGLNTAIFKWNRKGDSLICSSICQQGLEDDVNRNQINVKIDHNLSAKHKFNVNYTFERFTASGQRGNYPGKENDWYSLTTRKPQVITSSFVSTITPNVLNEARFGLRRAWSRSPYPYDDEATKDEVLSFLPSVNGYPVLFSSMPIAISNNILNPGNNTNANTSSLWTFADSLSWARGKHSLKGGVEVRFSQTKGLNSLNGIPHVIGGAGNVAVPTNAFTTSGLLANNETTARNLLLTLNGSINSISQAFILNDPSWTAFRGYLEPDGYYKIRQINQNEFSSFVKDDWKIAPSLTLNIGLRHEYFGVPWEVNGLTGAVVGGGLAGFGWTGRSFDDYWRFGPQKGDLTTVEFIGPKSPHPDTQLYKDDWNNFGPAVGFSWFVPWFGANKTSVRGGYSLTYQGGGRGLDLDTALTSNLPGIGDAQTGLMPTTFTNIDTLTLPVPRNLPLQPVSVTQARTSNLTTWDPNYVSPYIQNFTLSVTREVRRNVTLDMRYIGTRGVKLYGNIAINQANFLTNGLLQEFNTVRSGGESTVLNQMFAGLPLGTSPTGSAYLRTNTNWRTLVANGDVAGFASRLATTNELTGQGGGLVRHGGFPENFIVNNPQFNSVTFNTNPGSSTYHSLQTQLTFRPTSGLSYQATYVWSRGIASATSGFLNPIDRSLDRELQASHRTHDFRTNGTFELPIGPNKLLLANSSGWLARVIERWQLSWIANLNSGAPLNITGTDTYVNGGRLNLVGPLPKDLGSARMTDGLPQYLPANTYQVVRDPGCFTIASSLQTQCTNNALADLQGNFILVHAAPGTLGTLGDRWIEGPGSFRFDLGASKTMKIDETKSVQIRIDARNVLNHPILGSPGLNINNGGAFGQISGIFVTGARQFQGQLRVTF